MMLAFNITYIVFSIQGKSKYWNSFSLLYSMYVENCIALFSELFHLLISTSLCTFKVYVLLAIECPSILSFALSDELKSIS